MRKAIVMPDMGPGQMTFHLWLALPGQRVQEGDRVAEVLLGPATVDVTSPADGKLEEATTLSGEIVQPGQTLGWVET